MKLPAIAVSVFLLAQQSPPPSPKATIEGVVVRIGTGEPIEGAQVIATRQNPGAAGALSGVVSPAPPPAPLPPPLPPAPPAGAGGTFAGTTTFSFSSVAGTPLNAPGAVPPVTTGGSGKFAIKDLDPGAYRIAIAANGFTRQEYGQRVFPGQGTAVVLAAGQTLNNVVIRLTPAGTVTGRIRDSLGRPLAGVPVQLLKATYNAAGQKSFQSAGSDRTDDRGEYRLYWVTPGRYYLVAGSGPGPTNRPAMLGGGVSSPNEVPNTSYALTYYPGAAELSSAATLNALPGVELGAIDFTVPRQELRQVRGRIIDPRTRQAPPAINVGLAYRDLTGGGGSFGGSQGYNAATGTFELRNVVPGSYVIQATVQDATPQALDPAARIAANAMRPTASAPITVSNADVENVVLTLAVPVSINGRMIVEGQPLTAVPGLDRFRVLLRPSIDGTITNTGNAPQPQPVAADGTFRVDGVVPGEYVVSLSPLLPDFYLKEARFEQIDVLNQPMQFAGSSSGILDVVLSSRPGQIDGRAVDDKQQPVAGTLAVLIPDWPRNRLDLYKTATTDQNGAFTFRGVPPGDYKVFSWEALESYAFYDPAVLQQFEPKGKPVRVSESSKESVEVRIIPAESPQ